MLLLTDKIPIVYCIFLHFAILSYDWSICTVVGEGPTSGAMEASREIEEQLGIKNRKEEKDHKGKERDKTKEKKEEVDEEIIKVYDGYNSLRKRLFRTITVSKNATKDELLHASMKAFVVTQVFHQFNLHFCSIYYHKNMRNTVEILKMMLKRWFV